MVNRLVRHLRLTRSWWLRVLLVFVISRAVSVLFFLYCGSIEGGSYWNGPNPEYFDFLNVWDVEWFHRIFDNGYPTILPVDAVGAVQQNAWAFLPGFPYTVKVIAAITGLDWKFAAPLVSTLSGYCLSLVAYKLFALRLSYRTSLWAVLLFNVSAAAPVLQTGYSESLGLLFMALALYGWLTKRTFTLAIALFCSSLTRPGMAAFGLAFAIVWVIHEFSNRLNTRRGVSLRYGEEDQLWLFLFACYALALNFIWPTIAFIATGHINAYVSTELAWRIGYPDNGGGIIPLAQWFSPAKYYAGPLLGTILVLSAIIGAVAFQFWRPLQVLGREMRAWIIAYFAYLFAFFFPQSSIVRILMPTFVIFGAVAYATEKWKPWQKGLLIAGSLILQLGWLLACWMYIPPDYSPP